ncbi:hypothetical protein CCACVL1_12826 [Corchorus capsularis]|uniref:Uncharacterized protein n=1 Tax=Corchorus capsularis TaxID=210143 RepID=A0A1R3IDM8_COCAP|nr:hypothetical protein CCACVL1_12826 [Corchorus capsularis]
MSDRDKVSQRSISSSTMNVRDRHRYGRTSRRFQNVNHLSSNRLRTYQNKNQIVGKPPRASVQRHASRKPPKDPMIGDQKNPVPHHSPIVTWRAKSSEVSNHQKQALSATKAANLETSPVQDDFLDQELQFKKVIDEVDLEILERSFIMTLKPQIDDCTSSKRSLKVARIQILTSQLSEIPSVITGKKFNGGASQGNSVSSDVMFKSNGGNGSLETDVVPGSLNSIENAVNVTDPGVYLSPFSNSPLEDGPILGLRSDCGPKVCKYISIRNRFGRRQSWANYKVCAKKRRKLVRRGVTKLILGKSAIVDLDSDISISDADIRSRNVFLQKEAEETFEVSQALGFIFKKGEGRLLIIWPVSTRIDLFLLVFLWVIFSDENSILECQRSWEEGKKESSSIFGEPILGGDFNAVLSAEERSSSNAATHDQQYFTDFTNEM